MEVIYILLALSISVAVIFFTAFIIAVRSGQFDDTYTPSVRILFEDQQPGSSKTSNSPKTTNQ